MQHSPLDPALQARLCQFRRAIHQYPELHYREVKTGQLIVRELDRLAISRRQGVATTGIRAEIVGKRTGPSPGPGPCVALRADMDALPLVEETGLPFASSQHGVMHACGHDGHVAMLLGAANLLADRDFFGRVVLLFQPAEESGNGAERMVEAQVLDGVDMIFGGHIDTHYPTGFFTVDEGVICSFCDAFTIKVHGQGAHAARPHEAIDAVLIASSLVMQMQPLISRAINPSHSAVITVGRLEAGTVRNAIAEYARLEGTIRSGHPLTREALVSGLGRLVTACGLQHGASVELEFVERLPAVINESRATQLARQAAIEVSGCERVISQQVPSLGGEDFAFYQQVIPGCLVRFGAELAGAGPAHSGRYDFDEQALAYGSAWLAQVARSALESLAG